MCGYWSQFVGARKGDSHPCSGEVLRANLFLTKIGGLQTLELKRFEQRCLIHEYYSQTSEKSPKVIVIYFPVDRQCSYSISIQSNLLLDTVFLDFRCQLDDASNFALKYLVFPNRFVILSIDTDASVLVAAQGDLAFELLHTNRRKEKCPRRCGIFKLLDA